MQLEKEVRATSLKPRLDPRRRGYFLGENLVSGFPDSPDLSIEARRLIARWAQHFTPDAVTEPQLALLESVGPPAVSDQQRELFENQRELRTQYLATLFASLNEEDQQSVQDPSLGGERAVSYPLSVGQLSQLTGATERQLRKWADDGVLPSYREGSGRRFYSAATIRAFALVRASNHSKVLASAAARGEVGHHFQLLAATLGRVAAEMPTDLRVRLNALAEDLSSSSRLMSDIVDSDRLRAVWQDAVPSPPADSPPSPRGHQMSSKELLITTPQGARQNRKGRQTRLVKPGQQITLRVEHVGSKRLSSRGINVNEADRILSAKYGSRLADQDTVVLTSPNSGGGWVNLIAGQEKVVSVHDTKAEAEKQGRELARKRHGEHVIYLKDGVISDTHRYG